jgi:hypothetical protein
MKTYLVGGLILALGIAAGVQTMRLSGEKADHADTKAQHALALQVMAEAARKAESDAREEEQRRAAEAQKAANEAEQALVSARKDAASAAAAGERLRVQLATLTASLGKGSGNPSTPATSPSVKDSTALDLLANMLARHTAELVEVGEYADGLRIAGQTCERAWESLTVIH